MTQAASRRPSRGNIITAAHSLRSARGLLKARGLWAACGLALALGFGALGAPAAQAQTQPVTRAEMHAEFRVFRNEMRNEFNLLRAETRDEFKAVRADMVTRHELRAEIAEMEARLTRWMVNFVFSILGLVVLALPFYLLLLRRLMPGLFAPIAPAAPPASHAPAPNAAGTRPPRKASA